jgi:hypothetical protein
LSAAAGQKIRRDEPVGRTGGPAGNARLTAWLGFMLLGLATAEMVTLVSLWPLLTWHIVIGVLLVPPALAKTATTGWRILRYYTGHRHYVVAGPPPLLLRLLGPLVVGSTLALLGTGLALLALGPQDSQRPLLAVLGQQVNAVTLHQGAFAVYVVATGVHVLARTVPGVRILTAGRVGIGGNRTRALALLGTAVVAIGAAVVVLAAGSAWLSVLPSD